MGRAYVDAITWHDVPEEVTPFVATRVYEDKAEWAVLHVGRSMGSKYLIQDM